MGRSSARGAGSGKALTLGAGARLFAVLPEAVRKALGDEAAHHVITTGWYECALLSELSLESTVGNPYTSLRNAFS